MDAGGLSEDKANSLFSNADGNSDDYMSMSELKRALAKLEGSQDLSTVMDVADYIKISKDGNLSFKHFFFSKNLVDQSSFLSVFMRG